MRKREKIVYIIQFINHILFIITNNLYLFLEFDEQNTTLKRKLDKNLLLLIQQKVGNRYYWIPPQSIRKEGETMRQVYL